MLCRSLILLFVVGVVMTRDVKRAVCPSAAVDAILTCDQETTVLKQDRCPWLKARSDCLREIYLACSDVNMDMSAQVEGLLGVAGMQHYEECENPQ